MYPELFKIGSTQIHSYGFMIMLGALTGYLYMAHVSKKELNIKSDKIQSLCIFLILSAFVGGKLLFYLEEPGYYFNPPSNMLVNFRQGFVFYGSLLFAIPTAIWFFRKEKWPVWPVLDRLAVTATIVHLFGRMGCFFAGCCYGKPTDSFLGITFTDHVTQAKPIGISLHPTQLYEAGLIAVILGTLLLLKRHKRFEGQLFFLYIMLYAAGRSVIEVFRGDLRRGFIIEDFLSHSQFISLLLIAATMWVYLRFRKKARFKAKKS